jgi:hypothetical protein
MRFFGTKIQRYFESQKAKTDQRGNLQPKVKNNQPQVPKTLVTKKGLDKRKAEIKNRILASTSASHCMVICLKWIVPMFIQRTSRADSLTMCRTSRYGKRW